MNVPLPPMIMTWRSRSATPCPQQGQGAKSQKIACRIVLVMF